jgi:ATP-dependent Lhr-like helicase
MATNVRLGGDARAAYDVFLRHGALFPGQLASLLQLLPSQVEDVLGELAASGLVTSDGYPALRTLLINSRRAKRQGRRFGLSRPQAAGRWTLLRSELTPLAAAEERVEHWCRLLLRRYGIMFRDLLANESAAPSWQELVRTYRRLEARGEIRGGRFVAGVAGEQYALPEVIPVLRSAVDDRDQTPRVLPATDPLNFTGRISPGPRVPAQPGYSIVMFQGKVQAHESALRQVPLSGVVQNTVGTLTSEEAGFSGRVVHSPEGQVDTEKNAEDAAADYRGRDTDPEAIHGVHKHQGHGQHE